MREIKFRYVLRDKETKAISTMHYTLEEIEVGSIHTDFSVLGLIDRTKYDVVARRQYTGFKDSKGVAIYEGDVVYIRGCGNTLIEFPFIDLYEASFEDDIGAIVGNIYENPELLTKEDK